MIIDAISGTPKLTSHAGPKYFRVYASDAMAGKNNVSWALEEGAKTFGVVYVEDDWSSSYKDALLEALGTHGMEATVVPVTLKHSRFQNRSTEASPSETRCTIRCVVRKSRGSNDKGIAYPRIWGTDIRG